MADLTPAALRAEILSGPLAATLAAAWAEGRDNDVAQALNAPDPSRPQYLVLSRADMLRAVNATGAVAALKAMAANDGHPLQSTAYCLLTMLQDSTSSWDMDDPEMRMLAAALDVIHPEGVSPFGTATPGLGTVVGVRSTRPGSRAEELWGRGVRLTHEDVSRAREVQ